MNTRSEIKLFVILSAVSMMFFFGCQTSDVITSDRNPQDYAHPESIVSTDWMQTHLDNPDIRIVDCIVPFINPTSFSEGHIPGAVPLDVIAEISDAKGRVPLLILPENEFETLMGKLGISNDTTVVVYDAFGSTFAARLWWALMYYGHNDVKILNGGLGKWKAEGRALETESTESSKAVFKAVVQPSLLSNIEDVKQAIEQPDIYLVDALTEDHYFGRKPFSPMLAPPGHIPTAINIPGPSNISMETGVLLSPVELTEHWRKLKARPQDKVITYCGAGHYGAFDLFALYQIGYKRISLYDGSWIEWKSDPERIIAVK